MSGWSVAWNDRDGNMLVFKVFHTRRAHCTSSKMSRWERWSRSSEWRAWSRYILSPGLAPSCYSRLTSLCPVTSLDDRDAGCRPAGVHFGAQCPKFTLDWFNSVQLIMCQNRTGFYWTWNFPLMCPMNCLCVHLSQPLPEERNKLSLKRNILYICKDMNN